MYLDDLYTILNNQKTFEDYTFYKGEIFSAVETINGEIGIAASPDVPENHSDAEHYFNKILMQLRINARVNQPGQALPDKNIVLAARIKRTEKVVMAGYIAPVFEELKSAGLDVSVFDYNKKAQELLPLSDMESYLINADVLIATGTSFSNGSLDRMCSLIKKRTRLYVVGPSVPMSEILFSIIPQLEGMFGSIVISHDLIDKIKSGAGTRQLHDDLQKAALIR